MTMRTLLVCMALAPVDAFRVMGTAPIWAPLSIAQKKYQNAKALKAFTDLSVAKAQR